MKKLFCILTCIYVLVALCVMTASAETVNFTVSNIMTECLHENANWTIETLPTSTQSGNSTYMCKDCGYTKTVTTSYIAGAPRNSPAWTLDNYGVLTITQDYNSSMSDYSSAAATPWYNYREQVNYVVLNNFTTIGAYAFYDCTNLKAIDLSNFKEIGDYAFYNCRSLKSVFVSPFSSTTTIGDYAFCDCKALESVSFPSSTTLGSYAFAWCSSLKSIYICQPTYPYDITANKATFRSVTATLYCPYGIVTPSINGAHEGTITTEDVYYGTCGNSAHWNFDKSTGVLTVSGVGSVGSYRDYVRVPWTNLRDSITSIVVQNGITYLPSYVFEYCTKANTITLPSTLKQLAYNAFNDCTSLNNLILPASLEAFTNTYGFLRCTALKDVYYFGTEEDFAKIQYSNYAQSNGKTVHFLEWTPTTATCTTGGVEGYYTFDDTSVYDDMYNADKQIITSLKSVSALGHDYINHDAKAPSCSEIGYDAYTSCSRCEYSTYSGDIPKLAHTLTVLDSIVKLPTETETGICDFACETCGYVEATTTTYVAGGSCGAEASFVLDNYGTLVVFGTSAMADYSSADSRPWNSYASQIQRVVVWDDITSVGRLAFNGCDALTTVFLADTVKTIGITAFFNCSALEYVSLYDVTSIGTKAFGGCTNLTIDGLAGAYEETYASTNGINFIGHTHVENEEIVSATCTADGYRTVTCTDCGRVLIEEVLASLGHNTVAEDVLVPTCTESGIRTHTCSVCNEVVLTETINALGHDEVGHEALAPTCTAIGFDAYQTCSRCDYTTYVELPALGHDEFDHNALTPTCTEIGNEAYVTCSRCDYTTYVEIPALGHVITEYEAKAATCTENGYKAYEACARCDYTTFEEIVAEGHKDDETVLTEPTATTPGEGMYICLVCERVEFREIPCTAPNADLDDDGIVSVKDVLITINAVLNGTALEGADMNGDGKLTLIDVLRVLKAITA